MSTAPALHGSHAPGFAHEALFYAGMDEFVDRTAAFIREGVEADEPILVVVSAVKIGHLRDELGPEASSVQFADMADVGTNPARIIPAWRDFVDGCISTQRPGRGIGEPIWAERSPAELIECQRHESLLNLAFAGGPGWRLQCPYDTSALPPDVLDEARRSHPTLTDGRAAWTSDECRPLEDIATPFDVPLPSPPSCHEMSFGEEDLSAVRRFVFAFGRGAGLGARVDDLVLAANELATNSIRYGGGGGTVRLWTDRDAALCEVRDSGVLADPLAGRVLPGAGREGGRGLWLANQLCDLVQVRVIDGGTTVRLHVRGDDRLSATDDVASPLRRMPPGP